MTKEEFYQHALADSQGPLEGYRVLEVTQAVAGPVVGTVLADLGADVVRCELPRVGDMTRWIEPKIDRPDDVNGAAWYQSINRGKRAITLDLHHDEGQQLFKQLVTEFDVLVENFTPGWMAGLGLGYEQISAINPALIYVSVSGFGQWGPLKDLRCTDTVAQAMSGMLHMNGEKDGDPMLSTANLVDHLTGWQGSIGVMAALLSREKTGQGQHVDVALVDTAIYASDMRVMAADKMNKQWPRMGNTTDLGAPMNCYRCADGGYIVLFAILDSLWPKVCEAMGRPDLIADERSRDLPSRQQNREFVDGVTADWIARHGRDEVTRILQAAGVSVGPVLDHLEVANHPQYNDHEAVVEIDHPRYGTLKTYGIAPKFSVTPAAVSAPAPDLGEHNEAIYRDMLGIDAARLQQLQQSGVI
ncbi:MAG: CaiB/BaiF CoA-transferase family protein [Gammaproteobacteria bacterium]